MKQAVITTGGKQYLVREQSKVRVEKLDQRVADNVVFSEVLLLADGEEVTIGSPLLSGAAVHGKILRHGRQKKVTGAKVKAKKRYKRIFGHKQHFTEVAITRIIKETT